MIDWTKCILDNDLESILIPKNNFFLRLYCRIAGDGFGIRYLPSENFCKRYLSDKITMISDGQFVAALCYNSMVCCPFFVKRLSLLRAY